MANNMKYRIMIVAARKDKNQSLYKYLLDGNDIYEATTLEGIDKKIEKMLNEEDYSKKDFIVVSELEFNVFANVVDNTELGGNNSENSAESSESESESESESISESISESESTSESESISESESESESVSISDSESESESTSTSESESISESTSESTSDNLDP